MLGPRACASESVKENFLASPAEDLPEEFRYQLDRHGDKGSGPQHVGMRDEVVEFVFVLAGSVIICT